MPLEGFSGALQVDAAASGGSSHNHPFQCSVKNPWGFFHKLIQFWLPVSGSLGGLFPETQELCAAGNHPSL